MSEKRKIPPQLIPDIEDWPIYKLHQDRKQFVQDIVEFTAGRFMGKSSAQMNDVIAKTVFQERVRIKEEPWKVDPPNERQFWRRVRKKLLGLTPESNADESRKVSEEILRKIVYRYAEEIVGTFKISTFLFARKFLTLFFTRLLNTAAGRNWRRIWGSKYRLEDKLIVEGHIDDVRELMKKGTIVVVPTHFSNLDSILIGYALDTFVGLPSFSYGAGLNLYNTGYTAYFMNRLGAYRVDRRKKNPIYLETLKAMSNLSIQRGVNSLFFPGGTRSRAGSLETKLKLGLLSTAVEAQRAIFEKGEQKRVFIVPLVLSYHFVLEAEFLIEQHLRQIGKERYFKTKDESFDIFKIFKFTWQVFSQSNDIVVSIGQPMDVMGNHVNSEGLSFDKYGNPIDVRDYFISQGRLKRDIQRESEYTVLLAEKIVERYHKDNIVLTSHLVAFAAFEILKYQNARLDLYGILRLPNDDYFFPEDALSEVVDQLREELFRMEKAGEVKLSKQISWETDRLIRDGIARLGTYHVAKPLRFNKKGQIVSDSFNVLYFYHNRLENYGLDACIRFRKFVMEEALTT